MVRRGESGKGSVEAARLAIEEFGGKVNGKPIELVIGDHQNKADIGVSIANKWFDVEQVDAVADLVNSAVALGVQDAKFGFERMHGCGSGRDLIARLNRRNGPAGNR